MIDANARCSAGADSGPDLNARVDCHQAPVIEQGLDLAVLTSGGFLCHQRHAGLVDNSSTAAIREGSSLTSRTPRPAVP
jgi:hypothetical protein